MTYEPTPTDLDLERRIDAEVLKFHAANLPSERRAIWAMFKHLKTQRSAGMVRYLEEERGLI